MGREVDQWELKMASEMDNDTDEAARKKARKSLMFGFGEEDRGNKRKGKGKKASDEEDIKTIGAKENGREYERKNRNKDGLLLFVSLAV